MTWPPELFCDRSLGHRKVPDRLRQVHPTVIAHDDLFPQDTDDEVWLKIAGERGWVVLTRDDRIRYRPAEQRALIEAGTAVFCLNPSKGMTADRGRLVIKKHMTEPGSRQGSRRWRLDSESSERRCHRFDWRDRV